MAKSTYLSNSAKILSVMAGMLLLANIFILVSSFANNNDISYWASMFSNLCYYSVLIFGYIAFNGEAVAHKRNHDRKKKKVLGFFKLYLFICFLYRFIRVIFERNLLSVPADSAGGILARFGVSLLSTVCTYGFLFGALSLWYIIRDKGNLKLMLPQLISLLISIFYNAFKVFNYAAGKYKVTVLGDILTQFFSNNDISQILCIFQFLFNLIMLVCITVYYGKKGEEEQKVLDQNVKTLAKARNIIKDEGYGIDTLEDDFLISDN